MSILEKSDGPTAIFVSTQTEEDRRKHEAFLDDAAKRITPNNKTFEQMLEYLEEKYRAAPCVLSKGQMDELKANVILNSFPHVLQEPAETELTPEEAFRYRTRNTSFLRALKYPAQRLGLDFRAYELPKKESEVKRYRKREAAAFQGGEKRAIIQVEMKTQYLCGLNVGEEIINDLLLWWGVSQQDIDEKSSRFLVYVCLLKDTGKF